MSVKIYYRSPVIWNLVLFVFFSFGFLVLQEIYVNITTILNKELLLEFIIYRSWYIGLCLITVFALIGLRNISKSLIIGVILSTFVLTAFNLNQEFSKMILVILFFYLLIAYYLFQFFKMDLDEPFYNPGFDEKQLFEPMLKRIECELTDNKSEASVKGYLTNWSEEGCFVYLEGPFSLSSQLSIKIYFEGHEFIQPAYIASKRRGNAGYGLKFTLQSKKKNSDILDWCDFFEIIEQMGYKPELLT